MSNDLQPILVGGTWQDASVASMYQSIDPVTGEPFGPGFPVSKWDDVDDALNASNKLGAFAPAELRAAFIERYAQLIDDNTIALAATAACETGLPAEARFKNNEIPRTTSQLRQAAASARSGDWQMATIDSKLNIRSCLDAIGTVVVFGPANFPFAYNTIAGGDFASAIAAGNDVIGRAHPSHPQTTLALAKLLVQASKDVGLATPPAQLLFGFGNEDGLRLARDRRIAAIGFTGSRHGGLALKASADTIGAPFFGELSSINPVIITPQALDERFDAIVEQFVGSVLLASGQMCTNPGLVFLIESESSQRFINAVVAKFQSTPPGVLLSEGILKGLLANAARLKDAGAFLLTGGAKVDGPGWRFQNTALRVADTQFVRNPAAFQTEMFGNACLFVMAGGMPMLLTMIGALEGNLCGSVYLSSTQTMSVEARMLSNTLRAKVGRLLNDKMPTGVAVTSAMNHGGPYPATAHPHFTAVGFPASIRRFGKLDCYDNVRHDLLPAVLRDENPSGAWRLIDGNWTRDPIGT